MKDALAVIVLLVIIGISCVFPPFLLLLVWAAQIVDLLMDKRI